jgi:hypothetical protein
LQGKYIGLIIGFLVLIVLASGCIYNDEVTNNSSNSTQPVKTYSAEGISFNYSGNWHVSPSVAPDGTGTISISKDPFISIGILSFDFQLSPSPSAPQITVQITPNNVVSPNSSEQGVINQLPEGVASDMPGSVNSEIPEGWNEVSNGTITISNETTIEETFTVNDAHYAELMRFEQVNFMKNGKTYSMLIQATDNDFDKEKSNFEIILNSFNVQ